MIIPPTLLAIADEVSESRFEFGYWHLADMRTRTKCPILGEERTPASGDGRQADDRNPSPKSGHSPGLRPATWGRNRTSTDVLHGNE